MSMCRFRSIQNVKDAVDWLGYTYLYVRCLKSPQTYSVDASDDDGYLTGHRANLIHTAAHKLDKCGLIRYDRSSGSFTPTELGRISSHYYITSDTVSVKRNFSSESCHEEFTSFIIQFLFDLDADLQPIAKTAFE